MEKIIDLEWSPLLAKTYFNLIGKKCYIYDLAHELYDPSDDFSYRIMNNYSVDLYLFVVLDTYIGETFPADADKSLTVFKKYELDLDKIENTDPNLIKAFKIVNCPRLGQIITEV